MSRRPGGLPRPPPHGRRERGLHAGDLGTLLALDASGSTISSSRSTTRTSWPTPSSPRLATPICLDESIRSAADAAAAIALGAGRVINVKIGRVGGHGEALRVHEVAAAAGVPLWCGGMLESGVGRAHNIAVAALPGFSKPGDTSSSSRYFEEDIVEPRPEAADGLMPVRKGPGSASRCGGRPGPLHARDAGAGA